MNADTPQPTPNADWILSRDPELSRRYTTAELEEFARKLLYRLRLCAVLEGVEEGGRE